MKKEKTNYFKYIAKLLFVFLPLIVYFIIFLCKEPYNYWGIRENQRNVTSPISGMRQALSGKCENILIGDSKIALIDTEALYNSNITGELYYNFSFTGASTKEKCDMFWWANKYNDLKKVVIEINFWNMQEAVMSDRVPLVKDVVLNPLQFIFNYDYNLEFIKNLSSKEEVKADYSDRSYYLDVYQNYADTIWDENMKNYKFNYNAINELIDVITYCNDNNIEIKLVSIPMHQLVWDKVNKYDREKSADMYKKILSQYTQIYDMEYQDSIYSNVLEYSDGNHILGMDRVTDSDFRVKFPLAAEVVDTLLCDGEDNYQLLSQELKKEEIYRKDLSLVGDGNLVVDSNLVQLEENTFYEVEFTGSSENMPDIIYMDFYGENYDNYEQDMMLDWKLEKNTYRAIVEVKELPQNDIYFRVIYQGTGVLDISNLTISKLIER